MRLIIILMCACAGLAHAADRHAGHGEAARAAPRAWTDLPLIEPSMGRDRRLAAFRVANLDAVSVRAFAPGKQAPLPEGVRFRSEQQEWDILLNKGRFILTSAGVGNYHWLLAREESADGVKVASTAYYFSNPGPAPTDMLARPKSELEIVPAPLPREHSRYRENRTYRFDVRFQGAPLAGVPISFTSSSGKQARFVSDAAGRVWVRFPDDGRAAGGHGHGSEAGSRFVLAASHDVAGRHYLTAFNYSYADDAYAGRSLAWGGGFMALGGLIALPLIVRRRKANRG